MDWQLFFAFFLDPLVPVCPPDQSTDGQEHAYNVEAGPAPDRIPERNTGGSPSATWQSDRQHDQGTCKAAMKRECNDDAVQTVASEMQNDAVEPHTPGRSSMQK